MNDLSSATYDPNATMMTDVKNGGTLGKLSNGKQYSGLALSELEHLGMNRTGYNVGTWGGHGYHHDPLQRRRLPDLPRTPESTGEALTY